MRLALSPFAYLMEQASLTLPRLKVVTLPVIQVAHSTKNPTVQARLTGMVIWKGGMCPKCAQTARQKSRNVMGSLFWIKKASPAAVFDDTRFSAAKTWASATFVTYVTSMRLN